MEGSLFTIALVIVIAIGTGLLPRRWSRARGPDQTTEPPEETSTPDDRPRDGGDNPSAP